MKILILSALLGILTAVIIKSFRECNGKVEVKKTKFDETDENIDGNLVNTNDSYGTAGSNTYFSFATSSTSSEF